MAESLNKQQKRKWLNQLLVDGYVRDTTTSIPEEVILIICLFCSMHPPHYHILFDFEYNKKVHLKMKDIFPNLVNNLEISNIINDKIIICSLTGIHWSWNDQFLCFEQPDEEDKHSKFDHKLIQADNNGVHSEKWEEFMKELSASNIGIKGFVKKPREYVSAAVAFDRMNHSILDLMETEFPNCELRADWSVPFYEEELCKYSNVSNKCKPSEWIMKMLKNTSLEMEDVPIYFEDAKLCNHDLYIDMSISVFDEEYQGQHQSDHYLNICHYIELSVWLGSIVFAAGIGGGDVKFLEVVKDIIRLYKWTQDTEEIIAGLENKPTMYISTEREGDETVVTPDKLYKTLSMIDTLTESFTITMLINGSISVDWE